MLEYIYKILKYFLQDLSDVKVIGFWDEQVVNSDNGYVVLPAILFYPNITGIYQMPKKVQKLTLMLDVYVLQNIPIEPTDMQAYADNMLQLLKLSDTVWATLEGKNAALYPDNDNYKFFLDNMHRTGITPMNFYQGVKGTKISFTAHLYDLSAVDELTETTVTDIIQNITIKH